MLNSYPQVTLQERKLSNNKIALLMLLLDLFLTKNYLTGSPVAPCYASIFMSKFET